MIILQWLSIGIEDPRYQRRSLLRIFLDARSEHRNLGVLDMRNTRKPDSNTLLPEPIVLTPDQLKQIATATAGGLSLTTLSNIIRAGGIPPAQYLVGSASVE
jgi:hypothetical protein